MLYLICRSSHSIKEPVSTLHRFSQRRRRTYSDTDSCNDVPLEDPDSKLERLSLPLAYSARFLWGSEIAEMKGTDSECCTSPLD